MRKENARDRPNFSWDLQLIKKIYSGKCREKPGTISKDFSVTSALSMLIVTIIVTI